VLALSLYRLCYPDSFLQEMSFNPCHYFDDFFVMLNSLYLSVEFFLKISFLQHCGVEVREVNQF
jgi:hypothetical protein